MPNSHKKSWMVFTEGAVVEDDDEGYRTSPGSDTSPQSNNTASPPPKMAKKVWTVVISQVFLSYTDF